ncbi:glycosyl transferase family 2 [Rhodovulum bhavnagarense]|uniref:Glycosyl transferase family 2 n=1 Tax=Rhodovulum bhavnagarense TaxID=992286 RepID=A0A4R2RD68_9RHOB|nr:glycosyltransferase family 2 protein [Rhodovulum bhavnagarense]TCP59907.1 glycosyl transferase family 2 [Rhodovulum bhavnagarense]
MSPPRILLVTTARNEGPFLLEWLAHHLGAGATDILAFSNDCQDGTDAMLDVLAGAGILTHIAHSAPPGVSIQWQALRAAWKHPLRKAADWIMGCDLDEFVNIHTPGHTLTDLIAALPQDADAIALPWRLFGDNGVFTFQDRPVTEQFTSAIPPGCAYPVAASLFKTLFRAAGPFNGLGVHRPRQKAAEKAGLPRWVDGAGQPLPDAFAGNDARLSLYGLSGGRALAEINHYSVKSAESFLVKRARGLPNRADKALDLTYWVERNFNSVQDNSIAAMASATADRLAQLRAIPGLRDLHRAAIAWHRAEIDRQLATPEGHRLYTRLLVAGESRPLPRSVQHRLIGLFRTLPRGGPDLG